MLGRSRSFPEGKDILATAPEPEMRVIAVRRPWRAAALRQEVFLRMAECFTVILGPS